MNIRMMVLALGMMISCQNELLGASRVKEFCDLPTRSQLSALPKEERDRLSEGRSVDTSICVVMAVGTGIACYLAAPAVATVKTALIAKTLTWKLGAALFYKSAGYATVSAFSSNHALDKMKNRDEFV